MKKVIFGILYWLGQLTWGLLMTLIGLFAAVFCLAFLKGKPHKNGYSFIIEVGGNWGGVNLGAVSLCGGYTTKCIDYGWFEAARRHEAGHSLQNLIFGPFFPFIVAIPSAVRYWLDYFGKLKSGYYDIWFESTATSWGTRYIEKVENSNK